MPKKLIWEKTKETQDSGWEGIESGARVLLSRVGSWSEISLLQRIAGFPRDDDAFEALIKNGFTLSFQSLMETLEEIPEDKLPEWFGMVIPEKIKNEIPQRFKNKFPKLFA
jgi:hypothetical protein